MYPVLFEIRGIRVWSYPAFLWLGIVLGMVAQNAAANARGLNSARVYVATLLLLPIALIGARFLHVAANWRLYRREPERIWGRSEGGMSMLGGVPCMLLASALLLPALGVSFWAFWDVSSFCILVGMVFARVGCLLNGCCCGRPARGPLAIWLPDERGVWQPRIPVQMLEGAWALVLLGAAILFWRGLTVIPGALFLLVVAIYSAGRIVLQALRAERERIAGLDLQQAISIALIVWSGATLFWLSAK